MANTKTASFVTITDLNDSVPLIRGTQAAVTGTWTGVAPFKSLENGQQISYLLPFNGSGNATLNLTLDGGGTTGAVACYYGGTSRLTTQYGAGNIIRLTYIVNNLIAGTNYTGWWADANYNVDTYDRTRVSGATKAGTGGVAASRFVVADDTGYRNLAVGSVFDITKPILWATTAVAAGASSSSAFYSVYPTCPIAQGQTDPAQTNLTVDKIAYIKGTMNGNWFTVTGAPIFTDVVPTTEDGFIYYSVGRMSTATNCLLGFDHGLYYYKNGAFTQYTQTANEALSRIVDVELRTTEEAIVGTVRSHQDYYGDLSSRVLSETYESKMSMLDEEIALKASEQSVSDLETRVSTAEQILTSDSITSLVRTSNEYRTDMQNVSDEITTVQSALGNKADASALANYATTALVNEIRETEISQRNESIEFAVSAEITRAMGVEGEIKTFTDRAKTYFVFDLDGLTLGKDDSPFKTLLGNEKLSFKQNGVEVAYIQYNRLYISVAEIMDMLTLGKATTGYTDIKTTKYGNEGGISGVWRVS